MLAKLYGRYRNAARQFETVAKAVVYGDESLVAKHLIVTARIDQGEYSATLEMLDQFLHTYPDNTWFLSRKAELLV